MATWHFPTSSHSAALPETATSGGGPLLRRFQSPRFFLSPFRCSNRSFLQSTPDFHRRIHRSAANRSFRCFSGVPQPPNRENPTPSSGVRENMSKVQDKVRIFFAVFFWMSLFFWYSVWDGNNDGRPNKGSRFRK